MLRNRFDRLVTRLCYNSGSLAEPWLDRDHDWRSSHYPPESCQGSGRQRCEESYADSLVIVAGKILTGWVVVIRTDIGILMGNSVIDVSKEALVRISQPVCLHFISLLITADRICFRDSSGIQNLNGSPMFPTSHVQNRVCDSELCRPRVGIHISGWHRPALSGTCCENRSPTQSWFQTQVGICSQ